VNVDGVTVKIVGRGSIIGKYIIEKAATATTTTITTPMIRANLFLLIRVRLTYHNFRVSDIENQIGI
jgi:hypothetical protein